MKNRPNQQTSSILFKIVFILLVIISSIHIYLQYFSFPLPKVAAKPSLYFLQSSKTKEVNEASAFDWEAYVLLYYDLQRAGIQSKVMAVDHLKQYGVGEGRVIPLSPLANPSFSRAVDKLQDMILIWDENHVPLEYRYLFIYYAKSDSEKDSIDVLRNNYYILRSALSRGNYTYRHQIFYWFNVANAEKNPLQNVLSEIEFGRNFAVVDWNYQSNDMQNLIYTLKFVPNNLKQKVGYLIYMNSDVRGPMRNRANLDWLVNMDYLAQLGKVSLVATNLICQDKLILPAYPVAISSGYWKLFENSIEGKSIGYMAKLTNMGELSSFFLETGNLIGSTKHLRKGLNPLIGTQFYNCSKDINGALSDENDEFIQWKPNILQETKYLMSSVEFQNMNRYLSILSKNEKSLAAKLIIPEVIQPGLKVDMFRQYQKEQLVEVKLLPASQFINSKVCFLIRTAAINDVKYQTNGTARGNLQNLIHCKLLEICI